MTLRLSRWEGAGGDAAGSSPLPSAAAGVEVIQTGPDGAFFFLQHRRAAAHGMADGIFQGKCSLRGGKLHFLCIFTYIC